MSAPVGARTSLALSEARTVHSRAETALYWLKRQTEPDQDTLDIIKGLETTVDALEPFRRTKRSR